MKIDLDSITARLAKLKSAETKSVRICRTGMKQWQKSAMLKKHAAKWGEPPLKWDTMAKTMDTREHIRHEET